MARSTMGTIITRLRQLVFDTGGTAQIFDDEDLQGYLDDHRTDVNYLEMMPRDSIASGGSVSYLEYHAGRTNWEGTVTIVDGNYDALTPDTLDYRRGVFTFASHQAAPVYITGPHYDLYAAAVDVLEAWAAREKLAFDFDADGADFKRSQKIKQLQELADRYRGKVGADGSTGSLYAQMERGDVLRTGW